MGVQQSLALFDLLEVCFLSLVQGLDLGGELSLTFVRSGRDLLSNCFLCIPAGFDGFSAFVLFLFCIAQSSNLSLTPLFFLAESFGFAFNFLSPRLLHLLARFVFIVTLA